VLALSGAEAAAQDRLTETSAEHAILVDYETGAVLFAKDETAQMPPSSMTKLMTVYILFQHLADGRLSLDDEFSVSEKAWRMGGSKMFVEVGKKVRVEDLIRGIVVQSGNDACIVVAEGLAGTEAAFADLMNAQARKLGLRESHFVNASGWPDPEHVMSARDLALLARHLIADFPDYYHYFAELSFTYNDIKQGNRNPLLYKNMGADGLKTGHTQAAGYGLVASAERDGHRLILVVNGLDSVNQRSRESARLLNWGFREFGRYELFKAGEEVAEAEVWLGKDGQIPLLIEEPLQVIMPRSARNKLTVKVTYEGPIPAPIEKGQPVARVTVAAPGIATIERDLVAGADVPRLGAFGRLGAAVEFLLLGAASR
jgi:D-alanyl-D-alanine carboxypeptidase (penicillin-binding protein 5/6)